jgi:hypothetical protein
VSTSFSALSIPKGAAFKHVVPVGDILGALDPQTLLGKVIVGHIKAKASDVLPLVVLDTRASNLVLSGLRDLQIQLSPAETDLLPVGLVHISFVDVTNGDEIPLPFTLPWQVYQPITRVV